MTALTLITQSALHRASIKGLRRPNSKLIPAGNQGTRPMS